MVDLVKDSYINFEDLNHAYLLSSYVLSLLDEAFLRSGGHIVQDSDVIAKKVRKYFVDEETIKEFLKENDNLDLSENYTYAYGDIISMFLADEVEKYGFSSDLIQYFLEKRKDLFSEEFMRECGFGPENYLKLYRKEVELIKK